MPLLSMGEAYPLTENAIDTYVEEAIGNYALGIASKGTFAVMYIGRSDSNLNKRLKEHIKEGYPNFKFAYADNQGTAYQKECQDYHAFLDNGKKLDNEIHPAKPTGSTASFRCPVCGQ